MKTPVLMLEDILAQVSEGINVLSTICKELPDDEKTDSALACLIRSFDKTLAEGYDYIKKAPITKKNVPTVIENHVFDALLAVRKLEVLSQVTHESFFKAEDEEDQLCSMFSVMWDYANEVGAAIRNIKQEIK